MSGEEAIGQRQLSLAEYIQALAGGDPRHRVATEYRETIGALEDLVEAHTEVLMSGHSGQQAPEEVESVQEAQRVLKLLRGQ